MLGDLFSALGDRRTYNPLRNGWALFGLAWGLPVPIFSLGLHAWIVREPGRVVEAWPIHAAFVIHPLLFMAIFGAVGTIHRRKDDALRAAMQQLAHVAAVDGLTGLHNRRHLLGRLVEEIERTRRANQPLSCIMLDLDGFKPVNDRHGHKAGDQVLVQVARRLDALKRDYDILGRLGGDEFVFVLPNTSGTDAQKFAERILAEIGGKGYPVDGVPELQRLTASIGVAVFPRDGEAAERLLASADAQMYRAKAGGRNRVEGGA